VELRSGSTVKAVTPEAGGAFTGMVPVKLGSTPVTVTAYNAEDTPTAKTVTVVPRAYGERVGGLTDPEGDDDRAGQLPLCHRCGLQRRRLRPHRHGGLHRRRRGPLRRAHRGRRPEPVRRGPDLAPASTSTSAPRAATRWAPCPGPTWTRPRRGAPPWSLAERFRADGRIVKGTASTLQSLLTDAGKALAAGDKAAAVRHMEQFVKQAAGKVTDAAVRTLLERDGRAVVAGLKA
jgi:hypothetical protein